MRVAYLGPQGTYSQEAASQHFSDGYDSLFCNSLSGVVESVVKARADYGVLPVENSTNGAVGLALDALLFTTGASCIEVCGEVRVAVRHQLYSRAQSLSSIKTVYSHPQVWGQVSQWLRKHLPQAKCVDCASTSAAVALALAPQLTLDALTPPVDEGADATATTAALGGPLTSDSDPLVADCADNPTNTTRFLILRQRQPQQPARGRTAVMIAHNTRASQLIPLLVSQGLVPTFLVPRPAAQDWEYSFFVEVDGEDVEAKAACLGLSMIGRHA